MIKAVLPADHFNFNDSQEKINVGQSWDLKVIHYKRYL